MESQTQSQGVLQGSIQTRQRSDRDTTKPPPFERWTDEEIAVLRQWQSDSFWFRGVPCSAAVVFGTEYLIVRGRLRGFAKWPRFLRISLTAFGGLLLGRSTSLGELHRRLQEQCPDGTVATHMRQMQEMRQERMQQEREDSSFLRSDSQERLGSPSQEVLPDSTGSQPAGKRLGYYDRLREQNKYSSGSTELPAPAKEQLEEKEPVFFADKPQTPRQRGKKNKYGDDWEN